MHTSKQKVKIFALGLSRTGTSTLTDILKQLDYKTYHFVEELLGETPDWDTLEKHDAFLGTPFPKLYKVCY